MVDSLYCGYVGDGTDNVQHGVVHPDLMKDFLRFARAAAVGEKVMIITHCMEPTPGYASTRETADYLLAKLDLEAESVDIVVELPPQANVVPGGVAAVPPGDAKWIFAVRLARPGRNRPCRAPTALGLFSAETAVGQAPPSIGFRPIINVSCSRAGLSRAAEGPGERRFTPLLSGAQLAVAPPRRSFWRPGGFS